MKDCYTECCCCWSLKGGTITVALIGVLYAAVSVSANFALFAFFPVDGSYRPYVTVIRTTGVIGGFIHLMNVVINCVLLHGVRKDSHNHIRSWLVSYPIANTALLVCVIIQVAEANDMFDGLYDYSRLILLGVWLPVAIEVLKIYFYVVVCSYFKKISGTNTIHQMGQFHSVPSTETSFVGPTTVLG